MRVTVKR